jgi:hypothetical protein
MNLNYWALPFDQIFLELTQIETNMFDSQIQGLIRLYSL